MILIFCVCGLVVTSLRRRLLAVSSPSSIVSFGVLFPVSSAEYLQLLCIDPLFRELFRFIQSDKQAVTRGNNHMVHELNRHVTGRSAAILSRCPLRGRSLPLTAARPLRMDVRTHVFFRFCCSGNALIVRGRRRQKKSVQKTPTHHFKNPTT